jgi:hypothetical protein
MGVSGKLAHDLTCTCKEMYTKKNSKANTYKERGLKES